MKQLLFAMMLFVFSASHAQTNTDSVNNKIWSEIDPEGKVFTSTEVPAAFPKGQKKLENYVEKNMDKAMLLSKGATTGEYNVAITFIVRKDGAPFLFEAVSKNGSGIEEEVIRVLKTIDKWEPAKQNSRKVTAYYRLKLTLQL